MADQRDVSLRDLSPLYRPEAFRKTRVFLLHGDQDTVVPPHHSRDFAAALKEKGCDVIESLIADAPSADT